MKQKIKWAGLKTCLVSMGLMLLAHRADAQKLSPCQQMDADRIKTKIVAENDDKVRVIPRTVRVFADDGFYKVVYVQEWHFERGPMPGPVEDGDQVHMVRIDLFNTALNRLKMPFDLMAVESMRRVSVFPAIVKDYFKPYLVMEIKGRGITLYCAFDRSGACVGYAEQSLVVLRQRIEGYKRMRDARYKPKGLSRKQQLFLERERQQGR